MMGQPQVVVGAEHDPLPPVDGHDGVLGVGDLAEVREQPGGGDLLGLAGAAERDPGTSPV